MSQIVELEKEKLKTLANCKPSEFLVQSNKIRRSASKWLKDTDILNIRKRQPVIPTDATEEEKKRLLDEQAKDNLNKMFDAVLEEYPNETLEILALCCFLEPQEADNYGMDVYFNAIGELLNSDGVRSFFTSLMTLA